MRQLLGLARDVRERSLCLTAALTDCHRAELGQLRFDDLGFDDFHHFDRFVSQFALQASWLVTSFHYCHPEIFDLVYRGNQRELDFFRADCYRFESQLASIQARFQTAEVERLYLRRVVTE